MRGRKGERRQSAAGAVNFWTAAHASRTIRDLSDQQPLLRIIAGGSQPAGGILVGAVGGEGVEQETASRPGQSVPADDRHAVHLLPDLFGIDVHESGHLHAFFPQGGQTAARHLARAQQVDPRMPGVVAFQPAGQPEGAQLVPYVKVSIIAPNEFVGNIMPMCQERRGEFKDMQYLDTNLVELHYQMPLNEIIYDFFDALKANTKGYASLDYELSGYRPSDLVKVDLLLNGDQVDALSFIAHRDKAYPGPAGCARS